MITKESLKDRECQCLVCDNKKEKEQVVIAKKDWNSYNSDLFNDESHVYIICDECILKMINGEPLQGKLKHYVVGDPGLSWNNVNSLTEKEKEKYSENILNKTP